jgi:periplasmic mercuric ion binding protein
MRRNEMNISIRLAGALASLLIPGVASAAQRTVTLAVENMTCATCAPTVKKSLTRVSGVTKVEISAEQSKAVVIFDDTKTTVNALVSATTNAGYPSRALQ